MSILVYYRGQVLGNLEPMSLEEMATEDPKLSQIGAAEDENENDNSGTGEDQKADPVTAVVPSFKKRSNIITIVGEQVSLLPTGLAGADNVIVNFDDKYKPPGLSNDEVDLLKRTLQRLFSGSGMYFGNPNPNPPCNKKEKELVSKSLTHRFLILRKLVQGIKAPDSLYFRQSLKHLFDLKGFIDWFDKAPCSEESDEPFLGALGALTDDEIKTLLRQFIFLILQGQRPLDNYQNADPNPAGFIGRLEKGALKDFQGFMNEYREHKYPIPERISKVLEVAELDLDAIKREVDIAVAARLKQILE